MFFFFQAEDGIRDTSVTGVQTCALPILESVVPLLSKSQFQFVGEPVEVSLKITCNGAGPLVRSEERRVGKECRGRGWAYDDVEKSERRDRLGAVKYQAVRVSVSLDVWLV